MTEVSIIMPVYNASNFLKRTLDSLINQTYSDFELICIDDGSTDNSNKIIEEYKKKDSRIKLIKQENSGPALARYNGINASVGKYLMFCDADDMYKPTMIEEMYNTIDGSDYDFVMCNHMCYDLKTKKSTINPNEGYYKTKFGINVVCPQNIYRINIYLWNKIIRKDLLVNNSIDYPKMYEHDDSMFMIRYFYSSKKYFVLNRPLYVYTINNKTSLMGRLSRNSNKNHRYDFIFSLDYLLSYVDTQNFSKENASMLLSYIIGSSARFYKDLKKHEKKIAMQIFKKLLFKYCRIFINDERCVNIILSSSFEEFNDYLGLSIIKRKLFSIQKNSKDIIIILFGIKITFKI